MSGRAGRRGLDDRGIAILMANKKLEPDTAKAILKGKSDALYSSFHLGYNMLLNMMRLEDIHPEDIILQSFHQFQSERGLPALKQRLDDALTEFTSLNIPNEGLIRHRRKLENQLESVRSEVRTIVAEPENVVPFLAPGRLIRVSLSSGSENSSDDTAKEWGWGILVNFTKQRINAKNIQ
jgi:ATP-dependent RNA helicase DOB1